MSQKIIVKIRKNTKGSSVIFEKTCTKCHIVKPMSCFNKSAASADGFYARCRDCVHIDMKQRYVQDPKIKATAKRRNRERYQNDDVYREMVLEHHRTRSRIMLTGCVPELYRQLLKEQKGVCKLCGKVNKDGRELSVDHCHKTGKIRWLLCFRCNLLFGNVQDDPTRLRKAADMLEEFFNSQLEGKNV